MPLYSPVRIATSLPMKVGGAPDAGAGLLASAYNHVHPLQETSGPSNLSLGDILNGEMWRRVSGNVIAGRALKAQSSNGTATSTVVTLADVTANLTFALEGGRTYLALWMLSIASAAATTGVMLSVNFTGTPGGVRYGVMMATGANTTFSQTSTVFDTLLGMPAVGPGSTPRAAFVFCRVGASTAGDLALRFASGVAGSSVTVGGESCGIAIQQ